ncbi:c-type cytochrome [Beggiatoa alba]|nr:c-type cytochrome [Beggiatoa alba]
MKNIIFILFISLVMLSCSKDEATTASKPDPQALSTVPDSQADFDLATVTLGGKLYKQNCAQCHGNSAEGNPDWRSRSADGKWLPPPLNGAGHTWHHSKQLLMTIITHGTLQEGGTMPGWGDTLSAQEIDAILTWVQSKWPEDIYTRWLEINRR